MPDLNLATSGIVAQACRFMEIAPVSSFGDDSDQARDLAEAYPAAMAECLEKGDWSFASKLSRIHAYAVLPDGVLPDEALPYLFAPPEGLIALRVVGDPWTAWRRDEEGIRADEAGPITVRYTRRVDSEALMPATFRRAVAARLATLLAPRWGGSVARIQWLEDQAEDALGRVALHSDARQASSLRYDGEPEQGDWVAEARA
jgi:hypothetical protein